MVNLHWIAAQVIWLVLLIVYTIGAFVMARYVTTNSIPDIIFSAVVYVLFMIITMGILFSWLPEPIQKYFRNKTPDNPDGCDI